MIDLEKRGRRIEIRSRGMVSGIKKAVPGAYLNSHGTWTVPLSYESYVLLRQKYGKQLRLGSELQRWIAGNKAYRGYMASLSASADAELEDLPRLAPKLAKAMAARTYQRVGVRFIADGPAVLIADDPGLGKTLIAMGGILESGVEGPYLIVCPKTAADSVWRREIQRWLPKHHRAVIMPHAGKQRARVLRRTFYGPHTWVIINPEMVATKAFWKCRKTNCYAMTLETRKQHRTLDCGHPKKPRQRKFIAHRFRKLFDVEWGAIVSDESHETLIVRTGKITQRRRGMMTLKTRVDGKRIALSGTPFDSKPHQLWGTLNWLAPQTYGAFHRWAELFWNKGEGYTGFEIGDLIPQREKLLWNSLAPIALRRTKAEVADDLPPKAYVGTPYDAEDPQSPAGIWLPMDGNQARAYQAMEELSVAELESGRLEAVSALAELTRLKQLACTYGDIEYRDVRVRCSRTNPDRRYWCDDCRVGAGYHWENQSRFIPQLPSNKFTWTVEALEEWGYPQRPLTNVVIVSFYTGILEMFRAGIEAHFKTSPKAPLCTAITGRTPPKDRRMIIDRFNTGEGPRVMLLNVKAGGTAITLDTADRMIFISETRNPAQQMQAEDRIHRISNPRHVMYYYLRSLGTVDVGTAYLNAEAESASRRLLDVRRGVDYVRTVLQLSH